MFRINCLREGLSASFVSSSKDIGRIIKNKLVNLFDIFIGKYFVILVVFVKFKEGFTHLHTARTKTVLYSVFNEVHYTHFRVLMIGVLAPRVYVSSVDLLVE